MLATESDAASFDKQVIMSKPLFKPDIIILMNDTKINLLTRNFASDVTAFVGASAELKLSVYLFKSK